MLLTFGKHRGKDTEDVPSTYLNWLVENHDDDDVVQAAEDELRYRTDHSCHKE